MQDGLRGEYTGHHLYDLDGDKIGTVKDIHYGDVTGEPEWLVVDLGLFSTKKILVPVGEVRRAGDKLSVPFTKERVKNAPRVEDDLALTEGEKGQLCRYYGLQYAPGEGAPADGCEEIQDLRPGG
jgi:sporulation protein YlmC with PRC-barrel domain